jgi:hypothetical protein
MSALLRDKSVDTEGKKALKPKDEVKLILGRSPDIGDTIIYRAWFELLNSSTAPMQQSATVTIAQLQRLRMNKNNFDATSTM